VAAIGIASLALAFINSWLATLLLAFGIAKGVAILTASLTNLGGIIGGIAVSEACDRLPRRRFALLAAAFVLGAIAIAALPQGGSRAELALAGSFFAGFFIMGTQNTANAIAATVYPTAMRSARAGWALGMGHIAQITAPLIGTALLTLEWPPAAILGLAALPPLIAALAARQIGRRSFPVAD
jgi:AAHS family 4-hydroxybenzoate transporter-like MFS transporter